MSALLPPRLYLVRHGETIWSISGQHTGLTDLPLTVHGQQMARDLQPLLQKFEFSRVLSSPRLRARSTCEHAGLGAAMEIDPDLAEWDYGEYEGLRTTEIRDAHPGWDIWRDGCPGGESPADITARADRLIQRLLACSGNVALFSHGQFGRVLAMRWVGLATAEGRRFLMDPASISVLAIDPANHGQGVIAGWNVGALPVRALANSGSVAGDLRQ